MQQKIKKMWNKSLALVMMVVLVAGIVPLWSVPAIADTVKKAYEMVAEPTLVYESVYGFYGDVSPVIDADGKWGAINAKGTEIVPCKYESITVMKEDDKIVFIAKDSGDSMFMVNTAGEVLQTFQSENGWSYNAYYAGEGKILIDAQRWNEEQSSVEYKDYLYTFDGKSCESDNLIIGDKCIIEVIGDKYLAEDKESNWYLLDANGQTIYSYGEYSSVYSVGSQLLVTYNSDWQNKMIALDGREIIPTCESIDAMEDEKGYIEVYLRVDNDDIYISKQIIMNPDGTVYLDNNYRWIWLANDKEHFIAQTQEDYYQKLDLSGNVVENIGTYDGIDDIDENHYIATIWGEEYEDREMYLLAQNGVVLAAGKNVKSVGDKFLVCDKDKQWSLRNQSGQIEKNYGKYDWVYTVENSYLVLVNTYEEDEKSTYMYTVMDYEGNTIFMGEKMAFGDPYIAIEVNGKWGIYKMNAEKSPLLTDENLHKPGNQGNNGNQQTGNGNSGATNTAGTNIQNNTVPDNTITEIQPLKKASISKVTAGNKKITIKIKKNKKAKGYLIQYSTSKKFKKAKTKYTTKTTATIKKLKSKKVYYVRVKAYKLSGKKKVLSKTWSKVKNIQVK